MLQQNGIYTYLIRIQNFLFHSPFDEIYRRLLFFTLGRSVSAWIDYTTKWNRQARQIRESDRHDGRYMYIPSFALPTCTKRHVMLNLTSTRVCNTGTSALYVRNLLLWITWWMLYRTLRKVTNTNIRKQHLRRDSKMCCSCCCCHFCCGAPTTDERIHATVLHDASHIAYCRYWGRASLPSITSIWMIVFDSVHIWYHERSCTSYPPPSLRVI